MVVLVVQSCMTLCDPMDFSPPGSSVHGISRQEYWSGLPFPSPGDLPDPGIEPVSPALAGGFFTTEPPGKPLVNGSSTELLAQRTIIISLASPKPATQEVGLQPDLLLLFHFCIFWKGSIDLQS